MISETLNRNINVAAVAAAATINVSHLPSGVYFVKIGDKRGKFVKE
ncbi:MAG: T9SS type A sorting domain-containing protein [Candidatus Symbiothrix sp.]|nr:T9SS type A sorting domain-containing protein [Candidatus Symbiothrix sp.]